MPVITEIEDLRRLYKRRVPKMFYDYAESGSWTEQTFRDNCDDFDLIRLRQRIAVDMADRTTRTRMIGDHHVANCLAATAVGLAAGVPLAKIVRGLESIEHVPGRLERLECGQEFGVFVDAAASPESARSTTGW